MESIQNGSSTAHFLGQTFTPGQQTFATTQPSDPFASTAALSALMDARLKCLRFRIFLLLRFWGVPNIPSTITELPIPLGTVCIVVCCCLYMCIVVFAKLVMVCGWSVSSGEELICALTRVWTDGYHSQSASLVPRHTMSVIQQSRKPTFPPPPKSRLSALASRLSELTINRLWRSYGFRLFPRSQTIRQMIGIIRGRPCIVY